MVLPVDSVKLGQSGRGFAKESWVRKSEVVRPESADGSVKVASGPGGGGVVLDYTVPPIVPPQFLEDAEALAPTCHMRWCEPIKININRSKPGSNPHSR